MKKTSFIVLTFAASFSISVAYAQTDSLKVSTPLEYLKEGEYDDNSFTGAYSVRRDTVHRDTLQRDTVNNLQQQQQPVIYNYYYRNRFFDGCFRIFFPHRYYTCIRRTGFIPRSIRTESHGPLSTKRGGFGHHGSRSPQAN